MPDGLVGVVQKVRATDGERVKMHLLEGKGVTKNFGGLTAVSDVDFYVDKGEVVGLIGPNGAGKTTLFNLISACPGAQARDDYL